MENRKRKRISAVLLILALALPVFALDFSAGIAYTQPAPLSEIRQAFSEKDLSVLVEGHQVTLTGSVTDNVFTAGLEAGVEMHTADGFAIAPLARLYAGLRIRPYDYFGISGCLGYQIAFLSDGRFAGDVIWRFSGEMVLEHVSVELFAVLPVPTDRGFAALLNLGDAARNARLGLSGSYRF